MRGPRINARWSVADPTPTPDQGSPASQPAEGGRVNPSMQFRTLQIAAGLGAAIAFVMAFMAAGAMLASLVFAVVGALLVAWIAYGVAKAMLDRRISHGRQRALPPSAG